MNGYDKFMEEYWNPEQKRFEKSRIYLQWLNFRGTWPMKLDRRVLPWLWGTAIFLIFFVIWALDNFSIFGYSNRGIELLLITVAYGTVFFAFILPVIFMLVDLLVHVPRAVHDDTTSSMLPAIMVTPVTTRSVLRDLTTWAFRLTLRHMAPSLLVASVLLIILHPDPGNIDELYDDIIPTIVLSAIAVAALWHFLLVTGLASAACPRWVWSTGSSLFFWVVPVLTIVLLATFKLKELIHSTESHTFPRELVLGGHHINFESWIVVPAAAIMLEIPTLLLAWYLPRLMERRRSGEWR